MDILTQNYEEREFNPNETRVYRAKLTKCRRGGVEISVSCPFPRPFDPIPPGLLLPKEMTPEERLERDLANARRAARHARQSLRGLLKTMNAQYLWTFTFRENIEDIKQVQKVYARFMRLFRERYPTVKFCCVPERHSENRTGWHLHVATADRLDVNHVRRCWWLALGHRVEIDYKVVEGKTKQVLKGFVKNGTEWVEALPEEIRGNVDVKSHSRRWGSNATQWDADRLASYLAKYMEKTFEDAAKSSRRFWPSKDCARPEIERFWLMATNLEDAIIESHKIVKSMYGCANLHIFLSSDYLSLWISGSGIEVPF